MTSRVDIGSQSAAKSQAAPAVYGNEDMLKAREAVAIWQSKLLDISKGNRLLRFRTTKLTTVAVVSPDLPTLFAWLTVNNGSYTLVPEPPQEHLPGVDSHAASSSWPAGALVCDSPKDRLWAALYALRHKAQAAIEERGVNVLFLALGFLCWDDPQEKDLRWRAPLILLPVTLERVSTENYKIRALDEDTILNPTLAHKLYQDHLLTLPELPDDPDSFDLHAYLARVKRVAVGLSGVAIEETAYLDA
jgi:hypothetical protein